MDLDKFLKNLTKSLKFTLYEFSKFTRMNLIFVKNLGFSIVCERFLLYLWGGRSPTMFYPRLSKMGLRPISSGAVRPPPAPLLLCLHPHRNLCAATSVAPPAPSQGLEGIMIRCIGIAYAR